MYSITSEQLTFLAALDPYLKEIGLSRVHFFILCIVFLFASIFVIFGRQIHSFKESIKAKLRAYLIGKAVDSHISADGKTVEVSVDDSLTSRILNALDRLFLAPEEYIEYDDLDEDDEDEEDEDNDNNNEDKEPFQEGFENDESDDESDKDSDDEEEEDKKKKLQQQEAAVEEEEEEEEEQDEEEVREQDVQRITNLM
jgi:signal transduction histidine kinase